MPCFSKYINDLGTELTLKTDLLAFASLIIRTVALQSY